MKIINLILAIIFILFAVVQYNDPDPWMWIGLYTFIAIVSGMAFFGKYHRGLLSFGMGFCFVYLIMLLPDFINWLQGGAESIVGSMKADKPHIELTREFLGLAICLAALIFHWRSSQRKVA